jgi:hypothetical protein
LCARLDFLKTPKKPYKSPRKRLKKHSKTPFSPWFIFQKFQNRVTKNQQIQSFLFLASSCFTLCCPCFLF